MVTPFIKMRKQLVFLLLTLIGLTAFANQLFGQMGLAPGKPQPPAKLRVYHLKYANAEDTAAAVQQLWPDDSDSNIQIVPDPRLNALIVQAPEHVMKEMETIIETLDRDQFEEKQVKIFQLQNIEPDATLAQLLAIVADQSQARVSIDNERGVVVAAGSEAELNVIEAVLMRLDEEAPKPKDVVEPLADFQVRVVWLVTRPDSSDLPQPSDDLANVIRELEKIGVTDLKVAAQVLVNTTGGTTFSTTGSTKPLDGVKTCRLSVNGAVGSPMKRARATIYRRAEKTDDAPPPKINPDFPAIDLDLLVVGPEADSELCHLQTTIRAPLGQSVVLGITPVESKASVFVVQLRTSDEK